MVFQQKMRQKEVQLAFALQFFPRQFTGAPDCFTFFPRLFLRRFFEVLLQLHFAEYAFAL